mmetsp:Transcript_75958/g.180644  ORF Transcript_75958/g.180644 Transcript_75958/m.180644 type:complete len:202 (-) Transcript_75958:120-725(-)
MRSLRVRFAMRTMIWWQRLYSEHSRYTARRHPQRAPLQRLTFLLMMSICHQPPQLLRMSRTAAGGLHSVANTAPERVADQTSSSTLQLWRSGLHRLCRLASMTLSLHPLGALQGTRLAIPSRTILRSKRRGSLRRFTNPRPLPVRSRGDSRQSPRDQPSAPCRPEVRDYLQVRNLASSPSHQRPTGQSGNWAHFALIGRQV